MVMIMGNFQERLASQKYLLYLCHLGGINTQTVPVNTLSPKEDLPLASWRIRVGAYLSMLIAQRFKMLAVHIITSMVTKMSQQMRLKVHTPPVT